MRMEIIVEVSDDGRELFALREVLLGLEAEFSECKDKQNFEWSGPLYWSDDQDNPIVLARIRKETDRVNGQNPPSDGAQA